jgi:protein-tyrosine-phosphatase
MKILLVCTGNTCRSPLAEAMLRRALKEEGVEGVEVSSAGTGAWIGEPVSEGSYLVGLERGLDLASHRARLLGEKLVTESDLILTMARGHRKKLEALGAGAKTALLGEYAGLAGAAVEVPDPVGGPIEGYRAAADQIEAMTRAVARRLAAEAGRDKR